MENKQTKIYGGKEIQHILTKYAHQNSLQGLKKYIYCAAKAVHRGKFIAIKAYVKKEERLEINNLNFYLKKLKKQEQTKAKISRRKEKVKIRQGVEYI